MYQIVCDNEILYDLRIERYVIDPKLDLELNKSGTLSFSIPANNPCVVKKLNGVFELFRDGKKIFEGRTLNDNKDFYNTKKVEVLGALDYFNDSIIRPFEFHNISVADFFEYLITSHNKQVDSFKQFKVGNVDVIDFDGEETLYRKSEEYKHTMDIIQDRLLDRLGGYITIRYELDGKYIDYTQKSGAESSQIIQFGKNLLDITEYTKGEDIKTCIIPLGAAGDDGNKLTIAEVNNGKDYIYDETAVALYGWIWEIVEFQDVTVASNLLNKGQKYLQECINLASTIELSAVDLNLIDKTIESFDIGQYPLIISKPHNLSKNMQINKMQIALDNPGGSKITLGNTIKGFTDKQIETKKQAKKIDRISVNLDSVKKDVSKNGTKINEIQENITVIDVDISTTNEKLEKQKKYIILGV